MCIRDRCKQVAAGSSNFTEYSILFTRYQHIQTSVEKIWKVNENYGLVISSISLYANRCLVKGGIEKKLWYWHWDTKWLKSGGKNLNCYKGDRALSLHKSPCIFTYFWKFTKNWILWILLWNWFQIKVQTFLFQYQKGKKFYLVSQLKKPLFCQIWRSKFQLFSL